MLGYGALNGSVMNARPVNSGTWLMLVKASSAIAIASGCAAVRRAAPAAQTQIAVAGAAVAVRRVVNSAASALGITGQAAVTRRVSHLAGAVLNTTASLALTRRISHAPQAVIRLLGLAKAAWRSLRPTERARTFHVNERRVVIVTREDRHFAIPRDARALHIAKDRGVSR